MSAAKDVKVLGTTEGTEGTEIFWQPASVKPDDSLMVLVGFADGDVLEGYWDSEAGVWRSTEAVRFAPEFPVVCWAELPAVPERFLAASAPSAPSVVKGKEASRG